MNSINITQIADAAIVTLKKTHKEFKDRIGTYSTRYNLQSTADQDVDLLIRMLKAHPTVRIWFAFPHTSLHTVAFKYAASYKRVQKHIINQDVYFN